MRLLEASDILTVNITVYGPPGTGKTSLGVTSPAPLILLSEKQGVLHIKQAAKRLKVPVPPVLLMSSLDDYRGIIKAAHGDRGKPFGVYAKDGALVYSGPWPETIVIDSLTDVARIVVSEIHGMAPPKPGVDGLPVNSQRYWSALQDRMQAIITAFRDIPISVLFLCLSTDKMAGEEGAQVRAVSPNLPMNSLPGFLSAASNVVGHSYRGEKVVDGKQRVIYGVMFAGPEAFMLKGCAGLKGIERPDVGKWMSAIMTDLVTDDIGGQYSVTTEQEGATKDAI